MSNEIPFHTVATACGSAEGLWIEKTDANGDSQRWRLSRETADELKQLLGAYLERTAPELRPTAALWYSSMTGWAWNVEGEPQWTGPYFYTESEAIEALRKKGFRVFGN